jgi:hypothetical protein
VTGVKTWTTRHGDTVEVYRARDGWRYRVQARGNNEIGDVGGEAYARDEDAVEAAQRHHPIVNDLTDQELIEQSIEHVTDDDDDAELAPEDLIEVQR